MDPITGIHHVTAICGDAQTNLDYYTGTLGLRLVKLTVNFDDPTAYHLYYGDEVGSPGTIITFFPYPGGHKGRSGDGQFTRFAFAIPLGSASFWQSRLNAIQIQDGHLRTQDPDGLELDFIEVEEFNGTTPYNRGGIEANHAIYGVYSVTLATRRTDTMRLLVDVLPFEEVEATEAGDILGVGAKTPGTLIEVVQGRDRGQGGPGTIHHIAWRVADDLAQKNWQQVIEEQGLHVSPVMDRGYFHSIYFREPGGALFEIATDPPGFAVDEPLEALGTQLRLPAMHEPNRKFILERLPALTLPSQS